MGNEEKLNTILMIQTMMNMTTSAGRRKSFARLNQVTHKSNKQLRKRKSTRMKRKKRMMMTIWENMICGEMMIKITKKIHQRETKTKQTQELKNHRILEVDPGLEIDDDQDVLDPVQVQDHLDPVEDAKKIEKMAENIDPDRQAVVHPQDQGQGALADGRDDALHLLGQGLVNADDIPKKGEVATT